jgi:hypothetical protein
LASAFKDINDLPDPLPIDVMAIAIKGDKIVLYIESTGRVTGYRLDVVDGFNLSYLLLGATLQRVREMGTGEAPIPEREAFEKFLGDIEVDLDRPADTGEDDLRFF